VLPRTLDANLRGAACGASLWAAECGIGMSFGRVVECGCAKCA
jgi:hypothetical protein